MRITKASDVRIGQWYAECCEHGLYQIADQHDEGYVRWRLDNPDASDAFLFRGVWETRDGALADLALSEDATHA